MTSCFLLFTFAQVAMVVEPASVAPSTAQVSLVRWDHLQSYIGAGIFYRSLRTDSPTILRLTFELF